MKIEPFITNIQENSKLNDSIKSKVVRTKCGGNDAHHAFHEINLIRHLSIYNIKIWNIIIKNKYCNC